jgi:hypothetical protein
MLISVCMYVVKFYPHTHTKKKFTQRARDGCLWARRDFYETRPDIVATLLDECCNLYDEFYQQRFSVFSSSQSLNEHYWKLLGLSKKNVEEQTEKKVKDVEIEV